MSIWNETIYTWPSPQNDAPLEILMAGITHPDTTYHMKRPKSRGIYVLEYVVSGKGHVIYENNHFSPSAGDVYFLQPHSDQEYYSAPDTPWEKIWINSRGRLMDMLCNAYNMQGLVYFPQCPVKEEFIKALDIVKNRGEGAQLQITLQLHKIISLLHDWHFQRFDAKHSREGLCLREYLDANWQKKISIAELAAIIMKSPAQTMRIFQKDWGDTPYNYLQKLRCSYACRYLNNTEHSIKELASLLGFKDEFYFSN